MKNNVVQFPQPHKKTELPTDKSIVIFTLGEQRFAVRYTVTEVKRKPGEVIRFSRRRKRSERQAESK